MLGTFCGVNAQYETAIVGGGAAGLSAALLLGRARRRTLVLDDGRPRNAVATEMHGFITRDGTPPHELLGAARNELARYNTVEIVRAHVDGVAGELGGFTLRAGDTTYEAARVLLATGVYDALPPIEGVRETWGRGTYVCPYCDGWEIRDQRIAVIGPGRKAVELAQELRQWTTRIVICTQGVDDFTAEHRAWIASAGTAQRSAAVARIDIRSGAITGVTFEDGTTEACDAVFISAPLRAREPLVQMLNCAMRKDGEIAVDAGGRTSVPGVYAAGDAVTTIHQVVLAAASGVSAAIAVNDDALKEDVRRTIAQADRKGISRT